MIESFLASWDLFGTTYAVGLASAGLLALVGVWVVARDKIFLGAAVSQASTLGVAAALWLGRWSSDHLDWLESDLVLGTLAVSASIATAWLAGGVGRRGRRSAEEVTGWVFLAASSIPVLLAAHDPHGLEEIHRLVFSTLLSASRADLIGFVALALGIGLAAWRFHAELLLFAIDPEMAASVGMRPSRWNGAVAIALGAAVGLSIRSGGMLYTFGCLVLPALVAKSVCREVRPMLIASPAIALAAALAGFFLAHGLDLPPAHVTVTLLCLALASVWSLRSLLARGAPATPPG